MRFRPVLLLLIVPLMAGSISSAQETQPAYRNPKLKVERRGGDGGASESERAKGANDEAGGRDEHESQQRSERSQPAEHRRDEHQQETHGGDEGDSGQSSSDSGEG